MVPDNEILVFISHREATCSECGENLGSKAWITLRKDKGALCLSCADLDHLVFLPSEDAALTLRAKKHATLTAVVLRWSRSRKRYERQGILVDEEALQAAEAECLQDSEAREKRRLRQAEKRSELDQEYVNHFAQRVRGLFPLCPAGREFVIAEHACQKFSGRIGRTQAAKEFSEEAIRLAVVAHIRHTATRYDHLLALGVERAEARAAVASAVKEVLCQWESDNET